jgi:hypothetical protein
VLGREWYEVQGECWMTCDCFCNSRANLQRNAQWNIVLVLMDAFDFVVYPFFKCLRGK